VADKPDVDLERARAWLMEWDPSFNEEELRTLAAEFRAVRLAQHLSECETCSYSTVNGLKPYGKYCGIYAALEASK